MRVPSLHIPLGLPLRPPMRVPKLFSAGGSRVGGLEGWSWAMAKNSPLNGGKSVVDLSTSPKARECRAHLTQKSGSGDLEF